jgi:serine/threonine protein kinase
LHGVLASGGMATVHVGRLAGDVGFARTVAIKRLHPQYAADPEFVSMFTDEARLAGRLRHPNIVPVTDVIVADGEVLIVMDYVQGETLSRLVRSASERGERVPPGVAACILYDVLEGLHAAHESCDERGQPLGIVHRDISPQNIIVGVDGIARVLDFGVAKARGRSQVTRDGQLKGKLSYMAPEQFYGEDVGPGTDLFASAIVLWETLTGRRLFAGENEGETVMRIVKGDIAPPSSVEGVTPAYDEVVLKGLRREIGDRYASAREMAVALAAAAPKADSHEVAVWVEQVAADALSARRDLISKLESLRLPSMRPARDSVPTKVAPAPGAGMKRALILAGIAASVVAAVSVGVVVSRHGSKAAPSTPEKAASAVPVEPPLRASPPDTSTAEREPSPLASAAPSPPKAHASQSTHERHAASESAKAQAPPPPASTGAAKPKAPRIPDLL